MRDESGRPELSRRLVVAGGLSALAALMLREANATSLNEARSDSRHDFANYLADLVLPRTASPGAASANVGAFVLLALDHQMGGLTPQFLSRVHDYLKLQAGGDFMQVPRARAESLLEALDKNAYAQREPAVDTVEHAWRRIKAAIVAGYYTSQIGASEELVYEPVPGRFANIKLTPDFKCRSNDGFGGSL